MLDFDCFVCQYSLEPTSRVDSSIQFAVWEKHLLELSAFHSSIIGAISGKPALCFHSAEKGVSCAPTEAAYPERKQWAAYFLVWRESETLEPVQYIVFCVKDQNLHANQSPGFGDGQGRYCTIPTEHNLALSHDILDTISVWPLWLLLWSTCAKNNTDSFLVYFYFQCPFCPKAFLNSSFLQAHISRRHGSGVGSAVSSGVGSGEPSKAISPDHGVGDSLANNPQLETEFIQIKERLRATEAQLEEERRVLASLKRKVNNYAE